MLMIGKGPLEGWLHERIADLPGITHIQRLSTMEELAKAYNRARRRWGSWRKS
jgi:hypothetical protein